MLALTISTSRERVTLLSQLVSLHDFCSPKHKDILHYSWLVICTAKNFICFRAITTGPSSNALIPQTTYNETIIGFVDQHVDWLLLSIQLVYFPTIPTYNTFSIRIILLPSNDAMIPCISNNHCFIVINGKTVRSIEFIGSSILLATPAHCPTIPHLCSFF